MTFNPLDKMPSLPQIIYEYTKDPSPDINVLAWAGAFVLTMFVLALSLIARFAFSRSKVSHD